MNLAGSRLPPGSNKRRCKENDTSKPALEGRSFQRNEQQTFTDTRMFFFSLSQKEWLVDCFLKLYILLYIFFSKGEDWHLYSDQRDDAFKTRSQKHDKHSASTYHITTELRVTNENRCLVAPVLMSTTFLLGV